MKMRNKKAMSLIVIALILFLPAGTITSKANEEPYWIDPAGDLYLKTDLNKGEILNFILSQESGFKPNGQAVMEEYDNFTSSTFNLSKWEKGQTGEDQTVWSLRGGSLMLAGSNNNSSATFILTRKTFAPGTELIINESRETGSRDLGVYADVSVGRGKIQNPEPWHPLFEEGGSFRSQGSDLPLYWQDKNQSVVPMGTPLRNYYGEHMQIIYGLNQSGFAYAKTLSLNQSRFPVIAEDPYGKGQFIHPDVLHIPQGLWGHKFWMSVTPYAWSNDSLENACLYYSDNGLTFHDPTGVVNPIGSPTPNLKKGSYGSDPELAFNGSHLFNYFVIGHVDEKNGKTMELPRVRIYNGENITPAQNLSFTDSEDALFVSPAILYDKDLKQFQMWIVDIGQKETNTIYRFNSTDGIHFTDKQKVGYSHWKKIWHLDVLERPTDGKKFALMSFVGDQGLFLGKENDQGDFTVSEQAILQADEASGGGQLNYQIYRSSGVFSQDGKQLNLWVSGKSLQGMRSVYYMQAKEANGSWQAFDFAKEDLVIMSPIKSEMKRQKFILDEKLDDLIKLIKVSVIRLWDKDYSEEKFHWMISQGESQYVHGGNRTIHEIAVRKTGHDPQVKIEKTEGGKIKVKIIPTDMEKIPGYQVKISGKEIGIRSQHESLRIEKI